MRESTRLPLIIASAVVAAVVAGLLLGPALAPEPASDARADLEVRVIGALDASVAGAWIALKREVPGGDQPFLAEAGGGPTDARGLGRYRLPVAVYHLTVTAEGHAEASAVADLRTGDAVVRVRLPPTVSVEGRVVGPEGGVWGLRVKIRWSGGERMVKTRADGGYTAEGVPWAPGRRWVVDVDPSGFWRPPSEVRAVRAGSAPDRVIVLPIVLLATARVRGRLAGAGAAEAEILLTNRWSRDPLVDLPGETWSKSVSSGADGSFEVEGAPPGRLEAHLIVGKAATRVKAFEVASGGTAELGEIRVPEDRTGVIAGRVVFLPGQKRRGGHRLRATGAFRPAAEDGTFRDEGLFGDSVLVEAGVQYGEHFLMLEERVPVGRTDLVFRPRPASRLRLEFTDVRTGAPVGSVAVAVALGDPPVEGSGFYFFRDVLWTRPVPPGRHSLLVRAQGYEPRRLDAVEIHPDRETRLTVTLTPLP